MTQIEIAKKWYYHREQIDKEVRVFAQYKIGVASQLNKLLELRTAFATHHVRKLWCEHELELRLRLVTIV